MIIFDANISKLDDLKENENIAKWSQSIGKVTHYKVENENEITINHKFKINVYFQDDEAN